MDRLRVGVDILKKKNFLTPTGIQTPNRPACSLVSTGCPRRNVKYFRRVFLMLNYTDITLNTYIQS